MHFLKILDNKSENVFCFYTRYIWKVSTIFKCGYISSSDISAHMHGNTEQAVVVNGVFYKIKMIKAIEKHAEY